MNDLFPGYVQIPASAGDDMQAKWLAVRAGFNASTLINFKIDHVDLKALASFNRSINSSIHYIPEQKDTWQTPWTTLSRSAGDCEDYAILKYAILLLSGVSETQLSLVLGEIANMPQNLPHAFLVVELNGKRYILDNKAFDLVPATANGGKSFSTTGLNADYINWLPKKCTDGVSIWLFSKGFVINEVIEQGHA